MQPGLSIKTRLDPEGHLQILMFFGSELSDAQGMVMVMGEAEALVFLVQRSRESPGYRQSSNLPPLVVDCLNGSFLRDKTMDIEQTEQLANNPWSMTLLELIRIGREFDASVLRMQLNSNEDPAVCVIAVRGAAECVEILEAVRSVETRWELRRELERKAEERREGDDL